MFLGAPESRKIKHFLQNHFIAVSVSTKVCQHFIFGMKVRIWCIKRYPEAFFFKKRPQWFFCIFDFFDTGFHGFKKKSDIQVMHGCRCCNRRATVVKHFYEVFANVLNTFWIRSLLKNSFSRLPSSKNRDFSRRAHIFDENWQILGPKVAKKWSKPTNTFLLRVKPAVEFISDT